MIRIGTKVLAGKWTGTVWKVWRGHAFSIADDCYFDFRVHPIRDLTFVRGVALAPRGDLMRQRIQHSWNQTVH